MSLTIKQISTEGKEKLSPLEEKIFRNLYKRKVEKGIVKVPGMYQCSMYGEKVKNNTTVLD